MEPKREVKCINKSGRSNRYEKISDIGGDWGKASQAEAIHHIENGTFAYYVKAGADETRVVVAEEHGNKYLKTESDDTTTDNLLSLPECS